MSLYVVPAQRRHVRMLGPHLRAADATECHLLARTDPTDALMQSFEVSTEAFTAMIGNTPVGMFGHVEQRDGNGVIWLLGSERLTADLRDFLSASSEWWERITSRYNKCFNVVSEQNTLHLRWLKWMGCELSGPQFIGEVPMRAFTYVYSSGRCSRPLRCFSRGGNRPAGSSSQSGQ